MADSTTLRDYERLADLLSASKERIQAQNPYLAAARAFQPYVPPSGQHTLTTGLAAGLGGIAQGLMGAYGAKKANEEFGNTTQRAYNYIKSQDLAGMSTDPDPYLREMALTLAMSERERNAALDTFKTEEQIKAEAKAAADQKYDPRAQFYAAQAARNGMQAGPSLTDPAPGEIVSMPQRQGDAVGSVGASYAVPKIEQSLAGGSPNVNAKIEAQVLKLVDEGWQPDQARRFVVEQERETDKRDKIDPQFTFAKEAQGAIRSDPAFKSLTDALPLYQSMKNLIHDPSGAAAVTMRASFARVLDPVGVVRGEEIKVLQNYAATLPQQAQAAFNKWLRGEGDLPLSVRRDMLESARAKMNAYKTHYNNIAEQQIKTARGFGYNKDDQLLLPIPPQPLEGPEAIEQLFSTPTGTGSTAPASRGQAALGDPSLLGSFGQGVLETPEAAWQLAKTVGGAAANPIDTAKAAYENPRGTIDTVGNISSATSGALAGAAAGAPFAPFTFGLSSLAGAGLGALTGNYLYKKGKQATGAEEPTTWAEDAPELAYGAGQNLTLALLPKGIKTTVKGANSALKTIARGGTTVARELEKEALGVRQTDTKHARGTVFKDETGNVTSKVGEVVDEGNRIESGLDRLESENFFKDTGSSSAKIKKKIENTLQEVGKQEGALIDEASDIIDKELRAAGINKYRLKPNWSYAEDYIENKASSLEKETLRKALQTFKDDWATKEGTLKDLDKFKRNVTKAKEWKANASTEDQAKAELSRQVYRGLREPIVKNFEAAMQKVAPERTKDLVRALSRYEDYAQFEDTIVNRPSAAALIKDPLTMALAGLAGGTGMATGGLSAGGLAPLAARVGMKLAPIGTANVVRAATAPARGMTKVMNVTTDPIAETIGRIPREAVLGLASGARVPAEAALATADDEGTMVQRRETESPAAVQQPGGATQELVDAVIRAESGGKINAVSPKGAKGLMQLMDATGREWHKKLGLPGEYDPFDHKQNMIIGTAYLNHLMQRYGRKELALAAYNWGMGNLDKLIKRTKTDEFAKLKDRLPEETRKYVSTVLKKETQSA